MSTSGKILNSVRLRLSFSKVIVFLSLIVYVLSSTAQAQFAGGAGTSDDPYQIATAGELVSIGSDPDLLDKHFVLVSNIDLDPNLPGGQVFTRAVIAPDTNSIDNFQGHSFAGSLDGNGYKIMNLTINGGEAEAEYLGLFGKIETSANVLNLNLENVIINCTHYAGGLVAYNHGTINNCNVTGNILGGIGNLCQGGIAGYSNGIIINCRIKIKISCEIFIARIGGLVGENWGTISDCTSNGTMIGGKFPNDFGGLVGLHQSGGIIRCNANVMVYGGQESLYLGGLVGRSGGISVITNCRATGDVSAGVESWNIGGLIGGNRSYVTNCYSTGSVTSGDISKYIGGLIGKNEIYSITNCYTNGDIFYSEDAEYVGGLVGYNNIGNINKSFWNIETTNLTESAGGVGLTTAQMLSIQTYIDSGWDMVGESANGIADLWRVSEDGGYPELIVLSKDYQPHELLGSGTQDEPYQIATAYDLVTMPRYDWSVFYELVSDIDLSGITWSTAPIAYFDGKFSGKDFSISHMTINGKDDLSLFGRLGINAEIDNVQVYDANIVGGDSACNLAILAAYSKGEIRNCKVTGSVTGGENSVILGGLTGSCDSGNISWNNAAVNITGGNGSEYIGGLVGYNGGSSISNCYASEGVVCGDSCSNIGGLVGFNIEGVVNQCYTNSNIFGGSNNECLGGLVGRNGFIFLIIPGAYQFFEGNIVNCYATGNITGGDDCSYLGGFSGLNECGDIVNSYAVGSILRGKNNMNVGDFAGFNGEEGSIAGCYFLRGTDESDDGLAAALTDEQFKQKESFVGWDFDDIWMICEGVDYPRLQWQNVQCEE